MTDTKMTDTNVLMTSLDEIKSFTPCTSGWKDIHKGQGKTESDSVLFSLVDCVESNSISDVCWLLGKRKAEISICVKFARMCADSVKHLDNRASNRANRYAAYADTTANATANAAAYAAYAAAAAAANAADAAKAAAYAADAAYKEQKEKNKQFLIQCINEFTFN